jgi:hypothetical protein
LTNRTMLYKYYDFDTCLKYQMQPSVAICKFANTIDECSQLLHRAPWMASYDEWRSHIWGNETEEKPFLVPIHAIMGRLIRDSSPPDGYEKDYGVDLPEKYPQKVLLFPFHFSKFAEIEDSTKRNTMLHTQWARDTAEQLFSLGSDFFYGMLHRYTFQFTESVEERAANSSSTLGNNASYSIGLHSRHRFNGLDGCNIEREVQCLRKLLKRREEKTLPVKVSIMSDRPCTISKLTTWLEAQNLSVSVLVHEETTPEIEKEHGPFAGDAFIEDLAHVSKAQSAIVGMERSSSDLLRELIVFNQAIDQWTIWGTMGKRVDNCNLPNEGDPDNWAH